MITVAILINGNPIAARSAVNIEECASGYHKYKLDDGKTLLHRREDGMVKLAIEMLKSISQTVNMPNDSKTESERQIRCDDLLACPFCGRPPTKAHCEVRCDPCSLVMHIGGHSVHIHLWRKWNTRHGRANANLRDAGGSGVEQI